MVGVGGGGGVDLGDGDECIGHQPATAEHQHIGPLKIAAASPSYHRAGMFVGGGRGLITTACLPPLVDGFKVVIYLCARLFVTSSPPSSSSCVLSCLGYKLLCRHLNFLFT